MALPAHSISFIKLEYDISADLMFPLNFATTDNDLEIPLLHGSTVDQDQWIKYLPDYPDDGVFFSVQTNSTAEPVTLGIDIRAYKSSHVRSHSSGVYIFKPVSKEPYQYTKLKSISAGIGSSTRCFIMEFEAETKPILTPVIMYVATFMITLAILGVLTRRYCEWSPKYSLLAVTAVFLPFVCLLFIVGLQGATQGNAKVTLTPDSDGLLHFDVRLDTIPIDNEVVVIFKTPAINNGGTFYTDSNGLAMQWHELDRFVAF